MAKTSLLVIDPTILGIEASLTLLEQNPSQSHYRIGTLPADHPGYTLGEVKKALAAAWRTYINDTYSSDYSGRLTHQDIKQLQHIDFNLSVADFTAQLRQSFNTYNGVLGLVDDDDFELENASRPTKAMLDEMVSAQEAAEILQKDREAAGLSLKEISAETITAEQAQRLYQNRLAYAKLIGRQHVVTDHLAEEKIEELIHRGIELSDEQVLEVWNFYNKAADVVTRQLASGQTHADLTEYFRKMQFNPVVQSIMRPQDFVKIKQAALLLESNPHYVRLAPDMIAAKQLAAPEFENVVDVFHELIDPYRQHSDLATLPQRLTDSNLKLAETEDSYLEAMRLAVEFTSRPELESTDAALREVLGVKDADFVIDLTKKEGLMEVIKHKYKGDAATAMAQMERLSRLEDPAFRNQLFNVLDTYKNNGFNIYTDLGVLTSHQETQILELCRNCIAKGQAMPDPSMVRLVIAAGDNSQQVLEALYQPTLLKGGGRIPTTHRVGQPTASIVEELQQQAAFIQEMSEGTSMVGLTNHACNDNVYRFLTNRASAFYEPVTMEPTSIDLSIVGILGEEFSFVNDGITGTGINYFSDKVGSSFKTKAAMWMVEKGRKWAVAAGNKGVKAVVGKGLQKLGMLIGGKALTSLGLAALPTGVTQVLAVAKIVVDVAEIGLQLAEKYLPAPIAKVLRALPIGQIVAAKQFLEKHWKKLLLLAAAAAAAFFAFLWSLISSWISTAVGIMLGGIVGGIPGMVIGGTLGHLAPQIGSAVSWIGSKIGAMGSAITKMWGGVAATTTSSVVVPISVTVGAVTYTSYVAMSALMSAFSLPPFDQSSAYLAGNNAPTVDCVDGQGNPLETPSDISGWPVSQGEVWNGVGAETNNGYVHENAIDIVLPSGSTVRATHPGTVRTGNQPGTAGTYVVITSDDGTYETKYEHLSDVEGAVLVVNGQHVNAGDPIALSDNTGNSSDPHLHYEFAPRGSSPYLNLSIGCMLPGLSDDQVEAINNGCSNSASTPTCNFPVP